MNQETIDLIDLKEYLGKYIPAEIPKGIEETISDFVKEAEAYYKRTLDITKTHVGKDHPDYSSQLFNLWILTRMVGKIEEAENFF